MEIEEIFEESDGHNYFVCLRADEFKRLIDMRVEEALARNASLPEPSTVTDVTEDYVPRKAAAAMCRVCINTIFNWARKGLITKYEFGGRIYFKKVELLSVMKSHDDGKA